MAFDTQGALKAGYSPAEITDFLGKQVNFDVAAARENGYQDSEIMSHLESLTALDGGRKAAAPVQNAKPPKDAGFSFGDIAKSFGMGATGSTKALTDVAGAGNVASEALDRTTKDLQKSMTPERQAELARQEARMKAAEKSGSFLQEIKAGALNVAEAPIQSTAQALGSFVPYLPALFASPAAIALGLTGRSLSVVTAIAKQAPKVIGTAQGAGAVKGSIYEGVLKAETEAGVEPELAKQKADAAQAYFGKNFDQIALGLGLGYVAGSTGVEKFIPKLGRAAAPKNLGRRVAGAALSESLPEGAQGGQERVAQNIALQREGFDVDTFKGVAGAAAQEALMGALGSVPIAALSGPEKAAASETTDTTGTQVPPAPETTPAAPAVSKDRQQKIDERSQALERTGINPEDALRIAEDDVAAEEQKQSAQNAKQGAPDVTEPAAAPGVGPVAEGSAALREPIGGADRAGVSVAEQPQAVPTAQGIAEPQPGAVVSTGPATAGATVGAGQQPDTLTAEEELSKKSLAESDSTPRDELQAKIKKGASTPGPTYTSTRNETDTDSEGNRVTTPINEDYKVVRMDDGWTTVSRPDGSELTLHPPSWAAAHTDEQLIEQKYNPEYVKDLVVTPTETKGTTTDGNEAPKTVKAKTQRQKAPPATDVTGVDIAAMSAATDPDEIAQHLLDVDAEFNSLMGKDGRMPKKDTPKQVRAEALSGLYRALKAKLPPADTTTDTSSKISADERIAARMKANVEANEKAKADAEAKAKAKADKKAAEAQEEIDPDNEEALREKAEAEIDAGPIGEALRRIDDGDRVETKGQLRSFMNKLEKNGVLDDVSNIQEALSDREQEADDVLDTMRDELEEARDNAIEERIDELREEAEQAAEEKAEKQKPAGEELAADDKEELAALESALDIYNSSGSADDKKARDSADYIVSVAKDGTASKAVRERAKQMLEDDIDPKDISKGSGILTSSKVGQSKVDAKFTKFTNGVQAASHIMKTGNVFQKFLAKRLRGALGGVKFVVLEKGDPTPAALQKEEAAKWGTAFGAYVPADKTIYVRGASFGDMQGANNIVVLHELLHAATSQKIRLGKIAIRQGVSKSNDVVSATVDLIMIMGNAQQRFNELKAAGKLPAYIASLEKSGVFTDVDEFLAYGMSDETFQKFLMNTKGFGEDSSAFSKFVHTIAKFFGMAVQQENALMDLIVASDRLLSAKGSRTMQLQAKLENDGRVLQSTKIEKDEPAKIDKAVRSQKDLDKAVADAEFRFDNSKKAAEAAKGISAIQMLQDPRKVIPAVQALWNSSPLGARKKMIGALPTSFLVDWAGDNVPEIKNTYKLMQKMAGMTNQLLRGASELSNEVERAFRADPELRAKLDKITSIATLAGIDPASVDTAERNLALDKMWEDLGPEGRRVYVRIRDHFGNLSKYLSKLLDDQVNSSKLSALDKANLMKKIRSVFERGGKINPYFALVREGDFWLSMNANKSKKSKDYTFFMAETAAERDNVAREFAAERLTRNAGEKDSAWNKRIDAELKTLFEDGTFNTGNDIRALRKKTYSQGEGNMLSEVFGAIDKTDLGSPEANDSLKDAIYQAFLETMPDQSLRKQFIHRKGIAGFRPDVLRNTAHTSARMATQLARIKYSPLLRTSLSAAEDSIKGRVEFEPFVNEMKERVDAALAPKARSAATIAAGLINKASFIYYLSGASSALLQPLSLFQTGLPVLSRYGVLNATKEMGNMLKVWNQVGVHKTNSDDTKSWVMPSMDNKKLSPLKRKAYNMAAAMDLFVATQAGSVFEYKSTPTDELKSPKRKLAGDTVDALVFGGLMNSAERISREMLYEASLNLQLAKLGKPESSVTNAEITKIVEQAVYDTNEALGNYGEYNRPEFMNSSGGKVVTQFMMYPITVSMFLFKNLREMIKPMDQRTRGEAAVKFFGALGTTSILAGASGLPMFSAVMGLLGAAWDEMRDDLPEDLKSMSFELWFRTKFLDEQLGGVTFGGEKLSTIVDRGLVNAFTGLDIAGRTGWSNLFSREAKETATLRESATALMLEHAGPGVNMLLSLADGADAALQGDYAKAVKKWAPAGFRNFVNAHELATKGAKDNKGAQILSTDAVTTGQLIAQAIGFRPDLLANNQYATFKVLGLEQKIKNERNKVVENLDRAHRNGDNKAFASTLEKIATFNKKYPSYGITEDDLLDSLEKRAEQRGQSWRGVIPTEKNMAVFSEALAPSRRAASEAERKGRGE